MDIIFVSGFTPKLQDENNAEGRTISPFRLQICAKAPICFPDYRMHGKESLLCYKYTFLRAFTRIFAIAFGMSCTFNDLSFVK